MAGLEKTMNYNNTDFLQKFFEIIFAGFSNF